MENKETPVVEMNVPQEEGSEKPTYAQLEKQVYQLAEKCREFYTQLQQSNMHNTFKRLDYCFKVIENQTSFPAEFVEYCKADIMNIMDVSEKEPNKEG